MNEAHKVKLKATHVTEDVLCVILEQEMSKRIAELVYHLKSHQDVSLSLHIFSS